MSRSPYARQSEIAPEDRPIIEGIGGREDNQGADPGSLAEDDVRRPLGGRPRSEETGRHDDGMGANETVDGLSGNEEMARRNAEDLPSGEREPDEPVFDRGEAPPRI